MGNDRPEDRGGRGVTVIYLDELFLLNFVVDYLLLLAAGRLSGEILRRGWLALGAAIGAAYAAAAVLPGMGFLLHPLCKLGAAVLALLAGYGKSRRLLRVSLVFFAVSAAFGGGVFALQLLGGRGLTLQNGIFYSAFPVYVYLKITPPVNCVSSFIPFTQLHIVPVRSSATLVRKKYFFASANFKIFLSFFFLNHFS